MANDADRLSRLPEDHETDALSIADLYGEVKQAISQAFPRGRTVWVKGEIQSLSDRTGHCYIDLIDPQSPGGRDTPVLKVKCWQRTWVGIKALLNEQGIELAAGMVVTLRGRLDLYVAKGELGFITEELDVSALMGRMAAARAQLLRDLQAEGLLDRNKGLPAPPVPLTLCLLSSPDTEGERDFLGRLASSDFSFHVLRVPVVVQGPSAPGSIAAALAAIAGGGYDLVVVVRGGGSKADLAAFDTPEVARAIATMAMPVWVGIGHTGDMSVADMVAHRSFVTPTQCGQAVVDQVEQWWARQVDMARFMVRRCGEILERADSHHQRSKSRLVATSSMHLDRQAILSNQRAGRVARAADQQITGAEMELGRRRLKLAQLATEAIESQAQSILRWRRLLSAYDVDRQLQRGYSLTLSASGQILRSLDDVSEGDRITTRLADGEFHSEVVPESDHA